LQVNGLASTPYNVAVGGTDFDDYFNASTYWNAASNTTTLASAKGYIPETTWNNSCTNAFLENPVFRLSTNAETNCNNGGIQTWLALPIGGSGGKSNCTLPNGTTVASCAGGYAKPLWQMAQGVPNDAKRDLPDVSLFASSGFVDSFYVICQSDLFQGAPCSKSNLVGLGGTSASSPAFAGLLALVSQKTGSRQGNANHVFYSLAAKQSALNCNSTSGPAAACVFNDVTSGTIAMPCATGSSNCTTASAGHSIGILSGYQVGAGYDLATGLGSVNATNLINGWNSVDSGTTSTTSLTLNGGSVVNVTHGTPVSIAISVSPTSPRPTGLGSLIGTQGSEGFGIDTLTISNGTASGTTSMLPGGASYSVRAHYAGDANYAASDSNAVTVTVNPEPSATNVHVVTLDLSTGQVSNPNATSIPYGSVYVLRADVTIASGATCFNPTSGVLSYGCPNGTVSFALDGKSVGAGPLPLNSEGYTENPGVQLTGGAHNFQGTYSGDNSYLSSSSTNAVTVTPAPTVTGTQTLYPMAIGVPVTFSVMARSINFGVFGVPMSGTFSLFDGSTQVPVTEYTLTGVIYPAPSSPYVWETLEAYVTATFSGAPGTHTLTVKYSGDANYGASNSGPVSSDLVYPTQTMLSSLAPSVQDGQPVTFTAQIVPSQNANSSPSGNVVFNVNGNPAGTAAVSNNQAQLTVSTLYAGSVPITATYSGDSNYAASSGTFTETVTQVSTTTSLISANPTVTAGGQVTFTARVAPSQMGAAPLTGTVQFTANGTILGTQGVSNNQAQLSPILNTPGSLQVQGSYSGDQNYSASAGTFTETVAPAPPDFSLVSSGTTTLTVAAGQTATFSNVISVSALNGFAAQVNLSCSLPAVATATTCTVNPKTIAAGSGNANVLVTTMVRGLAPPTIPIGRFLSRPQLVPLLLPTLLLAFLILRAFRTHRQCPSRAFPFAALVLFLMLQEIGCGRGNSAPPPPPPPTGTPAGSYTVTVTATSGNTTHATTLTLIVN
jgi:hypothetical protein